MNILKSFLTKYVYRDWNIGIADIADNLDPKNIKWMRHTYSDRWFADPFIISDTNDCYIILVEEYLHATGRGRIARLYVSKSDCELIENETILDLPTHLSFPNYFIYEGTTYLYPENASAGCTKYYKYGSSLEFQEILTAEPLADAVIFENNGEFYILATRGENCNGNELYVFRSDNPLKGYKEIQKIVFSDNIARRAGNIFSYNGRLVSPAQVNNKDYGEDLSLQYLDIDSGVVSLSEFRRLKPLSGRYPDGFHTFNVYKNKVVVDGYRYRSHLLHKLYVKLRNPK